MLSVIVFHSIIEKNMNKKWCQVKIQKKRRKESIGESCQLYPTTTTKKNWGPMKKIQLSLSLWSGSKSIQYPSSNPFFYAISVLEGGFWRSFLLCFWSCLILLNRFLVCFFLFQAFCRFFFCFWRIRDHKKGWYYK